LKSQRIRNNEHFVYESVDEFREHYPEESIKDDWKNAKEGEWVHTDDGSIIQILRRRGLSHPRDSRNYKLHKAYVRTIVGTFLCSDGTYMDSDFALHPNRYTFSSKSIPPNQRVKERKTLTNNEVEFVSHLISGKSATESYVKSFGISRNPKKKATVLLKQDRIIKEVEKSVLDVAKTEGIDHSFILRRLKNLAEYGTDEMVQLRALTELGKAVGTLNQGSIKRQEVGIIGMFEGFDKKQIDIAKRPESLSK